MPRTLKNIWRDLMHYKEVIATTMMGLGIFATCIMFYSNVVQALDDVKMLKAFRDSAVVDIAVIKKELHDVHEWVGDMHRKGD